MSESTTIPPFVNKTMKFILRSPMHGMVSKSIVVISFTGKKSGKTISTPVSYSQSGKQVTIFTHAKWWKNLVGGAPVKLSLRGKEACGMAEPVVENKTAIAAALSDHLRRVKSDATFYGVTFDEQGNPRQDEIEKAIQTVVMVCVNLD